MKTFIAFSALVAVALAASPYRPAYHQPAYHPAPAPYHEPSYADHPASYQYGYSVQDDYTGTSFGANEQRDGYATTGEYRVALPDGRIQTVTYTVDDYSGYVADVKYSGEPKYDSYKPAPYKPAPYHPAPAYKPSYAPAYAPAPYNPYHG